MRLAQLQILNSQLQIEKISNWTNRLQIGLVKFKLLIANFKLGAIKFKL